MKKVTGIGGIFFKCQNPQKQQEWYKKHLGLNTDQYGTNFEWRQADNPQQKGFTLWGTFDQNTDYFEPSTKDFMINFRVQNIEALVAELKQNGVTVLNNIETYDYGKFVHLMDEEGNKIELWEPIDPQYEKIIDGRTF